MGSLNKDAKSGLNYIKSNGLIGWGCSFKIFVVEKNL